MILQAESGRGDFVLPEFREHLVGIRVKIAVYHERTGVACIKQRFGQFSFLGPLAGLGIAFGVILSIPCSGELPAVRTSAAFLRQDF